MKTSISSPAGIALWPADEEDDDPLAKRLPVTIQWNNIKVEFNQRFKRECRVLDEETKIAPPEKDTTDYLKRRVLVGLCKSLMLYGAPCHRIVRNKVRHKDIFFLFHIKEQSLENTARFLDIDATFFFIPGIMMICFGELEPQTLLIRCPQGFDMGKLARVTEVANAICKEHLSPKESIERLDAIAASSPTWSPWIMVGAHTISSLLTTPVMFRGSWTDTAVSGALGLLVGILTLLADRYAAYSNIFELSTTILVAFVAKALDQWVCFTGVSLSATATLLPGYTLTMAIVGLETDIYIRLNRINLTYLLASPFPTARAFC